MILKGDSGDRASCIPPVATCFGTFVLFPLICFGVRKMRGGGVLLLVKEFSLMESLGGSA